jgi:hypothetical protein
MGYTLFESQFSSFSPQLCAHRPHTLPTVATIVAEDGTGNCTVQFPRLYGWLAPTILEEFFLLQKISSVLVQTLKRGLALAIRTWEGTVCRRPNQSRCLLGPLVPFGI